MSVFLPYFVLIVCVVLYSIVVSRVPLSKNKLPFLLIFSVLFTFCALRDPSCYRDMPNYEAYFLHGYFIVGDATENVNVGYDFLNKIFKIFTDDFYVFSFVITFVILVPHFTFIRKYSSSPYLSIVIFIFVAYFSCFFLLRQYLAVAASLIAFTYLLKKKHLWFLVWAIIAASMHTSALVIIPVYYICLIPKKKLYLIIIFAAAIVLTASLQIVASQFFAFSEYYSRYLNSDYEATPIRLFMKAFFLFLYLFAMRKDAYRDGMPFFVLICIIIENMLYFGSSGIDGIYRLKSYFEVGEVIGIPMMLQVMRKRTRNQRFIIKSGVSIYMLLLAMSCVSFIISGCFDGGYRTFLFK